MFALAAFAQADAIDFAFSPPPRRSPRPGRRSSKGGGGPMSLIRTMRKTITTAAALPTTPWLPAVHYGANR